VGSSTETAAPLLGTEMRPESESRVADGAGRVLFDLFLTISLLTLLVFGALYIWPALSSSRRPKDTSFNSDSARALALPLMQTEGYGKEAN
jgi:hypothetical protein